MILAVNYNGPPFPSTPPSSAPPTTGTTLSVELPTAAPGLGYIMRPRPLNGSVSPSTVAISALLALASAAVGFTLYNFSQPTRNLSGRRHR